MRAFVVLCQYALGYADCYLKASKTFFTEPY